MAHADVRGVFVFDREGDALAFPSLQRATRYLEPVDVRNGEYAAAFTTDGFVVRLSAPDPRGPVVLSVTGVRDVSGLLGRLADHQKRRVDHGLAPLRSPLTDPVAVGNELLLREWEARWPQRPTWLSRRLHGNGPERMSSPRTE